VLDSLRDPNTVRLALARLISRAGGEAAFFVGIWGKAAFEFNATPGQQALLMASLGIFYLIGAAAAGVLVDRFDPKRVLIVGEILFVPATLALIFPTTILQMTAAVIVAAVFTAVVMNAVGSIPPFLTEDAGRLHRLNAAVEGATSAAFILGPAVGALIARWLSLDWIFVFDALTSVVAVALVMPMRIRSVAVVDKSTPLRELRAGFRFAYSKRGLRLYLILGSATWLSFGAFGALEPLFYRDVLGVGPEALGWVNAVFGIGLVAGSALLNRLPAHRINARLAAACVFGSGLGAVIYTGTDRLGVVVGGAVFWGVILGLFFPALRTLIQLDTPDHLIGRVMGVNQVHNQAGELLPLTFVPALAVTFGLQRMLVGSGVVLMALAVVGFIEAALVDKERTLAFFSPQPAIFAGTEEKNV
jgi:DHA3 family macrolide efflux protein-like MFS transporter